MGNYLSGPQTPAELPAGGPALTQPDNLSPELLPFWLRISALLPDGIAAQHDQQLVVQLCEALYVQAEAWKAIRRDGIETEDRAHGGDKRRNPAIITWRQAADAARQCMNLLGLSPVSRSRLVAAERPNDDPFTSFLRRRHGATE